MRRIGKDEELLIQFAMLAEGIGDLAENEVFVVVDGDHIGNSAATPLLRNDVETAIKVSKLIHKGQHFIEWWTRRHAGAVLIDGGDNSVLKLGGDAPLDNLREGYHDTTKFTLSIGVGKTTEQADKALVVAKWRGRDRVVNFDQSVEDDYRTIQSQTNDLTKLKSQMESAEEEEDDGASTQGYELTTEDVENMRLISQGKQIDEQDLAWLKECGLAETSSAGTPALTYLAKEIIG